MLNLDPEVLTRHPEWAFVPPEPEGNPMDSPNLFQESMPMNWFAAQAMQPNGILGNQATMDFHTEQFQQGAAPDGPSWEGGHVGGMPIPNYNPQTMPRSEGSGLSPFFNRFDGNGGPVPYDQGGVVSIGSLNPNDPATIAAVQSGQIQYNPAQYGEGNVYQAPTPAPSVQPMNPALTQPAVYNPPLLPGAAGGPNAAQFAAQNTLYAAQTNSVNAQRAVQNAMPQLTAAKSAGFDAQAADVAANQAYLAEQQRASEAARQAEMRIQAAKLNTADKIAVAQEQNLRNNSNYRYHLAGLNIPVEVKLPPGFSGSLPAGVRAKLQTLEDIMTDRAADEEKMNKFWVEAARIHAANTGLDVKLADIRTGRVALTIDELQRAANLAGLAQTQASADLQQSTRPPSPGLVWNKYKNTWTSQEEEKFDEQQYSTAYNNTQYGPYASMPIETLSSMAVSGVITDDTYRQALLDKGVPPEAADAYVRQAQYNRENKSNNAALAAQLAQLYGGGGNTNTNTPPPSTPLTVPQLNPW